MWCASTNTCFDHYNYLVSFPWGECDRWEYGPAQCDAPCATLTSCGDCTDRIDCGWCAATETCEAGNFDASEEVRCGGLVFWGGEGGGDGLWVAM